MISIIRSICSPMFLMLLRLGGKKKFLHIYRCQFSLCISVISHLASILRCQILKVVNVKRSLFAPLNEACIILNSTLLSMRSLFTLVWLLSLNQNHKSFFCYYYCCYCYYSSVISSCRWGWLRYILFRIKY